MDKEWWEHMEPTDDKDRLLEALDNQRIRTHQGENKLQWGYIPTGPFIIKEAYNILINATNPPTENKWGNV